MAAAPSTTTSPRWDMTTPRARGRCGSPTPASGPSGTGAASIRSRHSSRRRATRTPTPHPERPGQHHLHVDVRSCVSVNTAEEDIVVACGDEIQSSEVGDGVAFEAADMVEVELLQRFSRREPGGADTGLTAVGFSCRYFALQARRQVFFVAPVLRTGTFSQPSRGLTQRRGRDIEGKGRTAEVPFHRGQRRTDHRLDDEPSSASRAVASPSPSIAARQPRSAQSCCATAPAATRRVEVVVLAVISILLFALSFRMLTGLFRRRTYCAAANGTRLSANRPAHGMNSMSSNCGTSGGPPVSSNSGRPPPEQDDGPTMAACYGPNRCLRQPVRFRRSSWPHRCRKLAALTDDYSELAQLERVN